jgi:carboxylesterase
MTDPFFYEGTGDAAVLLVHGFTGTPFEMRELGATLAEAGFSAHGIRLPGHDAAERMIDATRHDWRKAVRDAYLMLRKRHRKVGVCGLSTGALLALDLAATPGVQVDAVASLAAPMFLYGWKARILLPLLSKTPLRSRMRWVKTSPGNIKDKAAQARHHSIPWAHIGAVDELRLLIGEVRGKLSHISAPLLVEHSACDTTALVQSAHILYRHAGSAYKEKVILRDCYHVITVDAEKAQVQRDVIRFMHKWLRAPAEAPQRTF